ncbi:MAG TPA: hypothetical protein VLV45_01755 [Gemmatimonadales bacterium]|nr:hypothetical protein [Gemmatimonadales bacterium]
MREPGHYYTAYFTSLAVGFDPTIALRNAVFAQMPDEVNALDAKFQEESRVTAQGGMVNWVTCERDLIQRALHSLTGGASETERNLTKAALRSTTPGTLEFGFLLHRFGDTYAHSMIGNETRMYDTGFGHAGDLNDPDLIHVRPGLFRAFVADLYATLKDVAHGLAPRLSQEQVVAVAGVTANIKVMVAGPRGAVAVEMAASECAQIRCLRDAARAQMGIELDTYTPESEDTMSWVRFKTKHDQFMHQLSGAKIAWADVALAVNTVARMVNQEQHRDLAYPLRPQ